MRPSGRVVLASHVSVRSPVNHGRPREQRSAALETIKKNCIEQRDKTPRSKQPYWETRSDEGVTHEVRSASSRPVAKAASQSRQPDPAFSPVQFRLVLPLPTETGGVNEATDIRKDATTNWPGEGAARDHRSRIAPRRAARGSRSIRARRSAERARSARGAGTRERGGAMGAET